MEMKLLGFIHGYQNLLGFYDRGSDSWDDPGEKSFVDCGHAASSGMKFVGSIRLSYQDQCCSIPAASLESHYAHSRRPMKRCLAPLVSCLGISIGALALPLSRLPIPSWSPGDCYFTREISCLSILFIHVR